MDVVWLKRDVRLQDHAPLARAFSSGRPVLLLYLYEPSQLAHPTVHGSHVHFSNEGLQDLERQLQALTQDTARHCITIREGEAVDVLGELHSGADARGIARLLAHQETGTYTSFERDIAVRKWCRANRIPFEEPACNGVIRGLRNRDKFTKRYNAYMEKPEVAPPKAEVIRKYLVRDLHSVGIRSPRSLTAITEEHRGDRDRLRGGETLALRVLNDFLSSRGVLYNAHISAPATAWTSCSRLSPYLAFGHVSIKTVTLALKKARAEKRGGTWPRSLAAFYSRLRWRSHFIQKLESQPESEFRAMCAPLDKVRTAEGDWCTRRYDAWRQGRTGYPMIDACMRCLIKHGWVNFRMRACLVSFACYNLWLDWRGISSHLARCFLDYEPGIHYPQLQMQAGVSGINSMRVYSPTKQAKDHDKNGAFIRRFVPELANVPLEHIHEPWKMPKSVQQSCGVIIITGEEGNSLGAASIGAGSEIASNQGNLKYYPKPIVGEASSAKKAKEILASLRKKRETRVAAADVLQRHGSRMNRGKRPYVADPKQSTIASIPETKLKRRKPNNPSPIPRAAQAGAGVIAPSSEEERTPNECPDKGVKQKSVKDMLARSQLGSWTCTACTLFNDKVNSKRCRLCKTPKES